MSSEPRPVRIQRKLGYCVVNWNIENFCFATCVEGCVIRSPEFCVIGEERTVWRLNLNAKFEMNEVYHTTLNLERLVSYPGPDIVRAHWKFVLQDKEGNAISQTSEEYIKQFDLGVRNDDPFRVAMETTHEISKKLLPFEWDTLIVVCRLIVHVEELATKSENTTFTSGSLSSDLEDLFTRIDDDSVPHSSIKSDVTFEVDKKYIKAHAVILHSRNDKFRCLLNDERNEAIKIDSVDYESTKNLISYLYSGNMDFVLENPSIQLFEVLEYFDAKDILSCYQPDEITMSTAIEVSDERFRWPITKFKLSKEYCIWSPILRKGVSDTYWQISIYPKGRDTKSEYIAISAQAIEVGQPLDVCVEIIMEGTNKFYICSTRVQENIKGNEVVTIDEFADRSSLFNNSSFDDGMMHIIFRLRITSGKQIQSSVIRAAGVFSNYEPFSNLSRDIGRMLLYDSYTDIDLVVEGTHHRYHKCILSARSRFFSEMFERQADITTADISNIDLKTFNILMSYIYSDNLKHGAILGDSIMNLSYVYDAAQIFDIYHFNDDFIKLWPRNFNLQNACAVLLFADEKEKLELKNWALKFIAFNIQVVKSNRNWARLAEAKPSLISEISEFVNNQEGAFKLQYNNIILV